MDAKTILRRALSRNKLIAAFDQLTYVSPPLERISETYADWVGEVIPDGSGLLIDRALKDAMHAYDKAPLEDYGTPEQMRAFVAALLKTADKIALVTVVSKAKDIWDPLRDGPLAQWHEKVGKVTVHKSPLTKVTPEAVRQVILARIVRLTDMEWIERIPSHPLDRQVQTPLYELLKGE